MKKWETSIELLKGRTNISERKHMLHKILNEEVDSHASQQDKNSMEGNGTKFSEAKASSWARKVELPNFDRSIEGGTDLKDSSFECDNDPLQFLKSENKNKEGSVIKNHILCGGEETNKTFCFTDSFFMTMCNCILILISHKLSDDCSGCVPKV